MLPPSVPDPREFTHSASKDQIRIGGADDLHVVGVPVPNPAKFDSKAWAAVASHAFTKELVARGDLIVRKAGDQVEVENRTRQPIVFGLPQ